MYTVSRYCQSDGTFTIFGVVDESPNERVLFETTGAAGNGVPRDQNRRNVGPLPCGLYWVRQEPNKRFKPPAFRLTPYSGNEMFGRSGFWIHGGSRSEGCILLSPGAREAVDRYRVRVLEVVPDCPKGRD